MPGMWYIKTLRNQSNASFFPKFYKLSYVGRINQKEALIVSVQKISPGLGGVKILFSSLSNSFSSYRLAPTVLKPRCQLMCLWFL